MNMVDLMATFGVGMILIFIMVMSYGALLMIRDSEKRFQDKRKKKQDEDLNNYE